MAFFTVNESFYLQQKLDQLKTLDAATYGNWTTTDVAKAFEEAQLSAQEHFNQYGWAEQLSADASFDVAKYLSAKAALLNEQAYEGKTDWTADDVVAAFQAAGLTVEEHFTTYGEAEGLKAEPVDTAPNTLTEKLEALKAAEKAIAENDKAIEDLLASATKNELVVAEMADPEAEAATFTEIEVAYDQAATSLKTTTTGASFNDLTAEQQAAELNVARVNAKVQITTAEATLASKSADLGKGVKNLVDTFNSKLDALNTAVAAATKTQATLDEEFAVIEAVLAGTINDSSDPDTWTIDIGSDAYSLFAKNSKGVWELAASVEKDTADSVYVIDATDSVEVSIARLDALLAALNADTKADAAVQTASTAAVKAFNAADNAQDTVDGTTDTDATAVDDFATLSSGKYVVDASAFDNVVDAYLSAISTLATNKQAAADLEKNIKAWEALADLVAEYTSYDEAYTDLIEAKDAALAAIENAVDDEENPGLGIDVLEASVGVVTFTVSDDLFLFTGEAVSLENFGEDGTDLLYIGTDYSLVVAAEGAKLADSLGDVAILEVIALDNGTDTVLYFEQKAFAGNGSSDADMVAVTLTGVTGAEFSLSADGFLTIA